MPDHVLNYVECDLPADVTLPEWRQARVAACPRPHRGFRSFARIQRRSRSLGAGSLLSAGEGGGTVVA